MDFGMGSDAPRAVWPTEVLPTDLHGVPLRGGPIPGKSNAWGLHCISPYTPSVEDVVHFGARGDGGGRDAAQGQGRVGAGTGTLAQPQPIGREAAPVRVTNLPNAPAGVAAQLG